MYSYILYRKSAEFIFWIVMHCKMKYTWSVINKLYNSLRKAMIKYKENSFIEVVIRLG